MLLTGTNLATPLHAAYEHVFHLSPLDVTLLVAVYAAAVMVALLARGPLSDTVGYRPVLVAAAAQAAGRRYRTDRALALGMMGLIVGLAGLIAAGAVGSAALLFGAIAVAGAGQG